VTFNPSVALDYETIEFLAFGHELVDALVAHVRAAEFGGLTAHRYIATEDVPEGSGWSFTYELEFDGAIRSKELFPVFITEGGQAEAEVATWLLDQSSRLAREDGPPPEEPIPPPSIEVVETADREALRRLFARQAELTSLNRARLEQERDKLVRYFDYRQRAAAAKLESVSRTFERLSASEDPDVSRIVPVWAKNLETARRLAASVAGDREKRLGELAGRDQVSSQHQLMATAFVTIHKPA
jgi:hypothetical protein